MKHPVYRQHTAKEVRSFCRVMAVFFGVLACLVAWRRHSGQGAPMALALIGASWVLAARMCPPALLRPLFHAWMWLAFCLNYVATRVLLAVVFFVAMLPVALIMRALGKNPLQPSARTGRAKSVWKTRAKPPSSKHFEKLFTDAGP